MGNDTVLRAALLLGDDLIDDGVLIFHGDRIVASGSVTQVTASHPHLCDAINQTQPMDGTLLPGLVDVHCHGGGGESFPNALNREQAMVAVMEHRRHGTTSLVASCVTASADILRARGALLAQLCDSGDLAGIHFEGPFVSHERKGAQDPTYIIAPDPQLTRELIAAGGGHVVTMTLAPEKDKSYGPGSVAQVLIEGGALPSWGHTDAAPEHARAALEYSREALASADTRVRRSAHATITHLFNGMRPLHHRDPGPIMEFVSDAARGGAILEMICDNVHLAPAIVRGVWETVGRDACVLITDAMAAAGMEDGHYQLGPQAVIVKDGIARLAEGESIAGGTAHLIDCVRVAVEQAGIPLADAVHMATVSGARILGRTDIGNLEVGSYADAVLVDDTLHPVAVWHRGRIVQ